jgi:VIT1/CCC1 family predicted Fe2+/Mn2+ transporter
MIFDEWIRDARNRLDIVAGLIDGILNALTLAAGTLVAEGGLTFATGAKVAAVTACTTSFVFFVAHYAQLRSELVRSARQLNLLSRGRLAATQLGRQILREALLGAVVASMCGVIGSTIPLCLSLLVPQLPIVGIVLTISLLGLLGWVLALSVFGSPSLWAISMMVGGIAVTAIGVKLNIIG